LVGEKFVDQGGEAFILKICKSGKNLIVAPFRPADALHPQPERRHVGIGRAVAGRITYAPHPAGALRVGGRRHSDRGRGEQETPLHRVPHSITSLKQTCYAKSYAL